MNRSPLAFPPLVALAAWILPGAGYLLIGQYVRGLVIGVTIIALFLAGIFIAGIRVIDVPGYDNLGFEVRLRNGQKIDPWDRAFYNGDLALTSRPLGEIINKPWYVGQILTGPICLIASKFSINAARPANPTAAATNPAARVSKVAASHARIAEIGSLYTAIAGMLNLLAMIDAASRAGESDEEKIPAEATA